MFWRILLVLLKSGLTVALFEASRPLVEAIGVHLSLVGAVSRAISKATAIPIQEAEILFLLVFMAGLLEITRIARQLMVR
ncbi:MAG TPA: hypothetical protein VLY24_21130 [Bryobacteraceae bacterium]|nr:hypothetical protein [Bryobacteraceae bacterium]